MPTATFLPVLGAEVGLPRRGGGDPVPDGGRTPERVLAPRPSPTPARRPESTPPRRSPRAARPAPARAPLTSCHTAHLVERPCQVSIGEDRDRSWQRGGDVIRGVNALGELVHEPTEGHRDLVYRLGGHHGGSGTAGGAALPAGCGHSGRGGRGGGASRCLPLPARGDRGEPAWHVRAGGRPVAAVRCGARGAPGAPRSRRSSRWRTSLAVTIYGGPLNTRDVTAHIRTEERGPAVTWAPACGSRQPASAPTPAPCAPSAPRGGGPDPPRQRSAPAAARRTAQGGIPVAGALS